MQKGSCLCAKWSCTVEPLCTQLLFTLSGRACTSSWGGAHPGSIAPARCFSAYIVLDQLDKLLLAEKT